MATTTFILQGRFRIIGEAEGETEAGGLEVGFTPAAPSSSTAVDFFPGSAVRSIPGIPGALQGPWEGPVAVRWGGQQRTTAIVRAKGLGVTDTDEIRMVWWGLGCACVRKSNDVDLRIYCSST